MHAHLQPIKPYQEERPWGDFVEFTKNMPSTVKIITVKASEALSLQSHTSRDEFWRVIAGEGFVTLGDQRVSAKVGDEFYVMRGTKHRIEGGTSALQILEISLGDFDEADIIRFDDRYGRASANS